MTSKKHASPATAILWEQFLIVSTVALPFVWTATQWVAFRLGFQSELGEPMTTIFGLPIYAPWNVFVWWYLVRRLCTARLHGRRDHLGREWHSLCMRRDLPLRVACSRSEQCHHLRLRPLGTVSYSPSAGQDLA